jgi:hypothetical protein
VVVNELPVARDTLLASYGGASGIRWMLLAD